MSSLRAVQKMYEGPALSRVISGVIITRIPYTGIIRNMSLYVGGTTFSQLWTFNVSHNGAALFTGGDRFLVNAATPGIKTGLNIPVTKGDILSLDLVVTGVGFLSSPVYFLYDIDLQQRVNTVVTASLSDQSVETGTISMSKLFELKRVVTSHKARIRLYKTAAARAADASREFGSYDWLGTHHKMICDLKLMGTSASPLDWTMSPDAIGGNGDSPLTNVVYYSIQNLHGSNAAITVNFYQFPIQE